LFLNIHPFAGNSETLLNSSKNEEFVLTTGGKGVTGGLIFKVSFLHETVKPVKKKRAIIKSKNLLFFIIKISIEIGLGSY